MMTINIDKDNDVVGIVCNMEDYAQIRGYASLQEIVESTGSIEADVKQVLEMINNCPDV